MAQESLAKSVATLSTKLEVFMTEMRPFITAVSEHSTALNGSNGEHGLKTRVSILEDCRDTSRRSFKYLWSAVVGIGTTLLGWILHSMIP